MVHSRPRSSRFAVLSAPILLAATLVGTTQSPAAAAVTSVKGEACGYITNVGLFGGPQAKLGCEPQQGTASVPADDKTLSPSVSLPPDGAPNALTAHDPDGATGKYGPATIFGGRWPADAANAPPSGPISVSTQGTPAAGTVFSSTDITLCPPQPTSPPCTAPGGFGPFPVEGDSLHVECTASEAGVAGSTQFVNAELATSTDADGNPVDLEPVPDNPPVNYTRHGVITNVGDVFTVVYNEQIVNSDGSLTVNAAHMYLFGPTAVGEVIKGQVTCGVQPNTVTPTDTLAPSCGTPVVAPVGPTDPTPKSPRQELIGVFDAGNGPGTGLQSITNVRVTNGTVQVPPDGTSYLHFRPGQTGPLPITATRSSDGEADALTMAWSFDATDVAGNTAQCRGVLEFPPVAGDDSYATNDNQLLSVPAPGVLANDTDATGATLSASSASDPAHGTVVLDADGSFTYLPDPLFTGEDTFTYVVGNDAGRRNRGFVTIIVAPGGVSSVSGSAFGYYVNVGLFGGPQTVRGHGQAPNAPATAASPSVKLPPDGSSTPVSASDSDGATAKYGPAVIFGGVWPWNVASGPPSGPMAVSTHGTPGAGSVTSATDIVLHPTPITVSCAKGEEPPCTAPGGIGPGPLIADEAHSTCTANESGVTGSATFVNGILETKYDANTQLPVLSEPIPVNPPPNYTRSGTIDHVGDRWTIVLNEQIIGQDSITVNAAHLYLLGDVARGDMVVASSTCSLSSTTPNAVPTANDDVFTTAEDTAITMSAPGLLANDIDADGDPLTTTNAQAVFVPGPQHPSQSTGSTYVFPSDPAHGTAVINSDGSFSYVPDANFGGVDSFTYIARDPRGANDFGLVVIGVAPVPDNPEAGDDSYSTDEDTPLSVAPPGVLANDADADGDALTAGSASDPPNGTVTLNGDGSFLYTPDDGFAGTDTFSYTSTDGRGGSDTATVTLTVEAAARPLADFDGDGASDVSVFRPSGSAWFVPDSNGVIYGTSGDVAVPADYDGDEDSDIAVFRPSSGVWFVQGGPTIAWGTDGDIPVPADYDGDGDDDIAVFRPSSGVWFVQGGPTIAWGTDGDIPVPADYDGDGDADIAVFRPASGVWFVQGGTTIGWGTNGDVPVAGDYDGDGDADIAVFRPAIGVWFVQGGPSIEWGTNGDVPVPADYDGDGDADVAVFRPSSGTWFVQGGPTVAWGVDGDVPLPLPAALQSLA